MMTAFQVGFSGTVLLVPSAWTRFVYRGLIYQRDEFDRFVVVGAVDKKSA